MSLKDRFMEMKFKAFEKKFEEKQNANIEKHKQEMFKRIDKVGEAYEKAIDKRVREIVKEELLNNG